MKRVLGMTFALTMPSRRLLVMGSLLIVLLISGTTLVLAQGNDNGNLIHACVAEPGSQGRGQNTQNQGRTGLVRIVDDSETDCWPGEVPLTWPSTNDGDTLANLFCASGEIVKWDGNSWVCAEDNTGSTGPVTVGGGVTGRWQGTISGIGTQYCGPGNPPFDTLEIVFVQDSDGNLTGTSDRSCSVDDVFAILGNVTGSSIQWTGVGLVWEGTIVNQNEMSGTVEKHDPSSGLPIFTGTWSLQRIPQVP